MKGPRSYPSLAYTRMLTDRVRMEAYEEALRRTVRPGCSVLDLGAGTGIMSLLACQLGAARVYAVDPAPALDRLPELAELNGWADRIRPLAALSTEITLPERVDVVVSDLRGSSPLVPGLREALRDARARHLAPGGVLIPARDRLWVALVEDRRGRQRHGCLDEDPWGLELGPLHREAVHQPGRLSTRARLLTPGQVWAEVDYGVVAAGEVGGRVAWEGVEAGTADGLAVWFDTDLVEGVGFSSGLGGRVLSYGQMFLPLPRPVPLAAGGRAEVELRCRPEVGPPFWSWTTRFEGPGQEPLERRQSTLQGLKPREGPGAGGNRGSSGRA